MLNRPALPNRNDLLDLDDETLMQYCQQETYKASGPGGQHRNKTDSAVRISLLDRSVVALCADHRSQHRNRTEALRRLRAAIAIEIRLPLNPQERLKQWEESSKKWEESWKLGKKDRRYARFLAHLLDVLAFHEWAIGLSADRLGVSTGKLVRTLSRDPHAWNAVNQARSKRNLVNLRRP